MSEQELRNLAESYVERQLKQANANVSPEKRRELVEAAIRMVDPKRNASDTDAVTT
jgi:hypothetical protein